MKTLIYILVIIIVCAIFQMLPVLPWWAFVIPCFFIGIYMGKKEVNGMPFLTGFLAGFILWAGATLFFHSRYGGSTTGIVAGLLGVQKPIAILFIGLLGGVLTALSTLSGFMLFKKEDREGLNIKMKV